MKPEDLNLDEAFVSYWNLEHIDVSRSAREQLEDLKEDLAQVQLTDTADELLLDIGWYPEHQPEGQFVVYGVREQDWDEPLFRGCCSEINELKALLQKARAVCLGKL